MNPLLRRTSLYPGESLSSLLTRLEWLNHHDSPGLLKWLALSPGHRDNLDAPTQTATYYRLGNLTRLAPVALYHATPHRFATVIAPDKTASVHLLPGQILPVGGSSLRREHLWPLTDTPYCPVCLRKAAYHRLGWLPIAVTACLDHRCLLVRSCPVCGNAVNLRAILNAACVHCGADLRDAAVISAADDEAGLMSQQAIQSWLGLAAPPDERLNLPVASPAALYRLLDGLRRAIMMIETGWAYLHQTPFKFDCFPCRTKADLTPTKAYALYATAFSGLINWPAGFYGFLDAYQRRDGRQPSGVISADLGLLYTVWLERRWQQPGLAFVQAAFDDYLSRQPSLSATQLGRVQTRQAEQPYLTRTGTAKLLHTTLTTVDRLMQRGKLPGYNGNGAYVDRAGALALQARWRQAVSLQAAADQLGLSVELTLKLAQAGLLEIVRGPTMDGSPAWRIGGESVSGLMARLRMVTTSLTGEVITLTVAAQVVSTYRQDATVILERVLTGTVRADWPGGETLTGLRLDRDDIRRLVDTLRTERPYITRQQLAAQLGVKIATVDSWAETGLLTPIRQEKTALVFACDAATQFQQDYVFSDQAAAMFGVGKLTVQKWTRAGRLKPVSGPGVDSLHRYLFRREEVERLRPENRMTGPQLAKQLGISRNQLWQWIKQGKIKPMSGPEIDGSRHYLFVIPPQVGQ